MAETLLTVSPPPPTSPDAAAGTVMTLPLFPQIGKRAAALRFLHSSRAARNHATAPQDQSSFLAESYLVGTSTALPGG
ncbi:hypothetical protein NDU88_003188 [Pleurodeles waltl]|uniref:Uncharacterized protein n=1 Tax=Pleurodeles waltl TaxID=8319 RepID=A0AAV7NP14_PLEWA|nr:hypothetical protein NDU88_003188 [Pleurodeles waltl]